MIHHNTYDTYMVGAGRLNSYEEALKLEHFGQQIYLIRDVQLSGLPVPANDRAEALAYGLIVHGQASLKQLPRLLERLPCDRSLRWTQRDNQSEIPPKRFTTGAYVRGPMLGTTIHFRQYPWTTRALAGVVSTWDKELKFTSLTLSRNVCTSPHTDKFNDVRSRNLMLPISEFQGGEVFVKHADGLHQLQQGGSTGHILSAHEGLPSRLGIHMPRCRGVERAW